MHDRHNDDPPRPARIQGHAMASWPCRGPLLRLLLHLFNMATGRAINLATARPTMSYSQPLPKDLAFVR